LAEGYLNGDQRRPLGHVAREGLYFIAILWSTVGTEWSLIARCPTGHDLRYQCSGDQLTTVSYLHELSTYKHLLPHIYDFINPTDSHPSYPGMLATDVLSLLNSFTHYSVQSAMLTRHLNHKLKIVLVTMKQLFSLICVFYEL